MRVGSRQPSPQLACLAIGMSPGCATLQAGKTDFPGRRSERPAFGMPAALPARRRKAARLGVRSPRLSTHHVPSCPSCTSRSLSTRTRSKAACRAAHARQERTQAACCPTRRCLPKACRERSAAQPLRGGPHRAPFACLVLGLVALHRDQSAHAANRVHAALVARLDHQLQCKVTETHATGWAVLL